MNSDQYWSLLLLIDLCLTFIIVSAGPVNQLLCPSAHKIFGFDFSDMNSGSVDFQTANSLCQSKGGTLPMGRNELELLAFKFYAKSNDHNLSFWYIYRGFSGAGYKLLHKNLRMQSLLRRTKLIFSTGRGGRFDPVCGLLRAWLSEKHGSL